MVSLRKGLFNLYVFLIEKLIARYHEVNRCQTGYDFHHLLIAQESLVLRSIYSVKMFFLKLLCKKFSRIDNAKFQNDQSEMLCLNWEDFKI